jgi:hypothetical protein
MLDLIDILVITTIYCKSAIWTKGISILIHIMIYFSGFFTRPNVAMDIAAQATFDPSVF